MLTAEAVKNQAKMMGADLVGIASMDRFEGAPKQQDPRYIFPAAQAAVVLAFRLPRGYFRGIEEGTYFAAYASMGYGGMNTFYMPIVLRELCCFIEDHGYEAAPVPNMFNGTSVLFHTQTFDPTVSRPVSPDKPHPDVLVDYRIAAFAAGMGEFGYSKIFLTPEFGPRQRFVMLLTDAPLQPDPLFEGKLCDRCKLCAVDCSGEAISTTETEKLVIAGRTIEYGKFDYMKCSIAYCGGKAEYNPFMRPGTDEATYANKYCGRPELAEAGGYPNIYGNNPAIEGARGCIRSCMVHLEETGVLTNKFVNRFRTTKPWRLG
ncbi:MAG: hypothetical protein ABFE08_11945 [Armatimonadia bacterium]